MSDARPSSPKMLNPFAETRDLYLLVAGIVLGILLGPAVFGRLAPQTYESLMIGVGPAARQVAEEDAAIERELELLRATDVTGVALEEHRATRVEQTLPLRLQAMEERSRRERTVLGWLTGIIVAVVVVMAIESLASPAPRPGRPVTLSPNVGRLKTVRYALMATWLALALAQPGLLRQLPLVFTGLLILAALVAGLIPLGPAPDEADEPDATA
jgi:hypothetical protein